MIEKLSRKIALYLTEQLDYKDDRQEVLSFGLQIALGTFVKTLTILIISHVLNIFKTTAVILINFVAFRRMIGGVHCDTFHKCYFASTALMIFLGMLAKNIILSFENLLIAVVLTYIACVIITVLWVPVGTEKKSIKDKARRLKLKYKTIFLLTIWAMITIVFEYYRFSIYPTASLLGVISAFFFATPFRYKFLFFHLLQNKI